MVNFGYYGGNKEYVDELFKRVESILRKRKITANYNVKSVKNEKDNEYVPEIFLIEPEYSYNNISGISFAEKVRNTYPLCEIVFISANYLSLTEIMCRYIKPTGYFIAPINDLRFFELMVRYINSIKEHNREKIVITSEYRKINVYTDDILYFTTEDKKIICVTIKGEKITFYDTMAALEKKHSHNFVRCHSGFLVNKYKILSVNKQLSYITLSDSEEKIPISRKYKNLLP